MQVSQKDAERLAEAQELYNAAEDATTSAVTMVTAVRNCSRSDAVMLLFDSNVFEDVEVIPAEPSVDRQAVLVASILVVAVIAVVWAARAATL
jgi:hypothetical protein